MTAFVTSVFALGFVFLPNLSLAAVSAAPLPEGNLPVVYLFYGKECPHCEEERVFLDNLKKQIPDLEIKEFEIWHNEENQKLFLEVAEFMKAQTLAVPLTIIGDKYVLGFDNEKGLGTAIKKQINSCKTEGCSDVMALFFNTPDVSNLNGNQNENQNLNAEQVQVSMSVNLPILGEIDLKYASLFTATFVLGLADGFNPCSMWALITLITLLLATGSRKKIWLAGAVFIIVSAISYFLFISAWLNTLVFIGYMKIIRIIIGVAAIIAGFFALKNFYTFKSGVCEAGSIESKEKIQNRFQNALSRKSVWGIIAGVAATAFMVNLVELMCSLGLPLMYTQFLTSFNLPQWQYYAYIWLYILFYMLDEIVVVAIAGVSMRFLAFNDKYSRWSRLIAGLLMLILGISFIFKPDLLALK